MMNFIAGIFFFIATSIVHPFHVSINEIEFNNKENSIEITKKVFTDDLERGLKNSGNSIFISKNNDSQLESLLQEYLNEKFKINVNGKVEKLIFIGYEIEEDAVWCYLQIEKVKNIKKLDVYDTTLFEIFPDQVNLVHFRYNDEVKSFKLDQKNPSKEISL